MSYHLQPSSQKGRSDPNNTAYWLQSTLDQYEVREISARRAVQLITRKRSKPAEMPRAPSPSHD
jgi:hypothetical protein